LADFLCAVYARMVRDMDKDERASFDRLVWPPVFTAAPVDLAEEEAQQRAMMNMGMT
jgi:hypothetical protein